MDLGLALAGVCGWPHYGRALVFVLHPSQGKVYPLGREETGHWE